MYSIHHFQVIQQSRYRAGWGLPDIPLHHLRFQNYTLQIISHIIWRFLKLSKCMCCVMFMSSLSMNLDWIGARVYRTKLLSFKFVQPTCRIAALCSALQLSTETLASRVDVARHSVYSLYRSMWSVQVSPAQPMHHRCNCCVPGPAPGVKTVAIKRNWSSPSHPSHSSL